MGASIASKYGTRVMSAFESGSGEPLGPQVDSPAVPLSGSSTAHLYYFLILMSLVGCSATLHRSARKRGLRKKQRETEREMPGCR